MTSENCHKKYRKKRKKSLFTDSQSPDTGLPGKLGLEIKDRGSTRLKGQYFASVSQCVKWASEPVSQSVSVSVSVSQCVK